MFTVLGISLAMLFGLCVFVAAIVGVVQFENPTRNYNEPRI